MPAIGGARVVPGSKDVLANVNSVAAGSGGSLTISPTTGAVVASRAALTGDTTAAADSNATTTGGLNGVSLAGLSTGLLTITTGTGVPASVPAPTGTVVGTTDTQTLSSKRITPRYVTVTQSATPTVNSDVTDTASITGLAQAITSMTTNLTGTPGGGDRLVFEITDNGTARAITWGAKFEASTVALPTTTVISAKLTVIFIWNVATSKWRCTTVA